MLGKRGQFTDWLSIAANLGIVAGLVLVAVQISQDRQIATTNFESESFANITDYYETLVGEDPSASLARAVFTPDELTTRDKIVLDALYTAEFAKASRAEALMGPDDVVSQVTIVRWSLDIISNSYAVAWWQISKSGKFSFAPRHRDAIDAALRNLKDIRQSKRQYYDQIDSSADQT